MDSGGRGAKNISCGVHISLASSVNIRILHFADSLLSRKKESEDR